ncbi:hypothetical protein C0Q70_00953 [Pomacea canaliculata]|uniref:VWFA domain-containing protein n=1 Tax=Pomacea canaliculata TaxID=400727 RepID=A0A2T7PY37_POMCA|nr:hypothetical protein C0Q70_00953 [Pomacea canaliculata]
MENIFGISSRRRLKDVSFADDSGEEKEKADQHEREKNEEDDEVSEEEVTDITADDDEEELEEEESEDSDDTELTSGPQREWQDVEVKNARPPHPLTVTHVNQTLDLQRLNQALTMVRAEDQSSEEWLQTHCVEHLKLTLKDLVDKGRIGKLSPDQDTGKVTQHIEFDAYDVNEFEYKLNVAIETYTKRIKWLLQGSKRVFGHVKGERIAVCIDSSNANLGFGRQTVLQESLIHLLDEQLSKKKSLYLVGFGTDVEPLWPVVRDVNDRIIEEGKEWVVRLKQLGGSNLLKVMKHVMKLSNLDTIVIILGSVPDQQSELLCDFIYQMGIGMKIPLHTVAYDCSNTVTNITNEVAKLPQSRFLPRPPGHDMPLRIEVQKFQPRCSTAWLKQHGMKAKHLDLYQVLAPNAYSYREDFIPVIKRAVQSQVHEKAMVQFAWHDGSTKNIHVDLTQLFEYQKQLKEVVSLYERRVDWLASGSRRILGTIVEKNVVLVIDTSVSNVSYLVHIQHSVRLLLEQQIANKDYFNIITFGGKAKSWKPTMVRPTPENLQDAWKWVLEMQCSGSRNFLSALRLVMENDEEQKHHVFVQGIYVFTSGVPDQTQDVVISYAEETASAWGATIHTILFNVDDYDDRGAIPGRYANITRTAECLRQLAHCTGIIESDDIQRINSEIDRALNFSRKCAMLVESVKKKYKKRTQYPAVEDVKALPLPAPQDLFKQQRALPAPKYTAFGSSSKQKEDGDEKYERRAISWRPSSASQARETNVASKQTKPRPSSAKDPMLSVRSRQVKTSHFFIEDKKHATGCVTKEYPQPKTARKGIPAPVLPELEDAVSTKEWMRVYSLSRLKLDLNHLISGPDCKHSEHIVKALRKQVSAKYCDIFPTVNIKGTLKHLQLTQHELNEYEVQVERILRRYLKRLQWLLSGSHRVFGTLTHKKLVLLVDTSGSMESRLNELKRELASLMWDQIYKMEIEFNIIQFSGSCKKWRNTIQPATESNCHDAVRWTSMLTANGNTCTLEALQLAFEDSAIEAIYLLTDGKPDTSTSLVLREVARMNADRDIPVNTISFNCSDSTANSFLHLLAQETGGRYHRCPDDFNPDMFAHKLLSEGFHDNEYPHLPDFEGDDLSRLGKEIALARKYLKQAKIYKDMYKSKTSFSEKPVITKGGKPPDQPAFVVGRPHATSK